MIGIDRYARWPVLRNAVSDARGVLELFMGLGFEPAVEPILEYAATGEAIRHLVTTDLAGLGPEDSLVLFFAGHGFTKQHQFPNAVVKTGYIIPVEGTMEHAATWVRLDSWLSDVARLPAKHILVILDACHSGIALDSVIKWRGAVPLEDEHVDHLLTRQSRRVITSALEDQRALDSGPLPGHSLFTGCLIEALTQGLAKPGRRVVTGSELALYVQQRVTSYPSSVQTPDFGALELDERGEMTLPLCRTTLESEPAPKSPYADQLASLRRRLLVCERADLYGLHDEVQWILGQELTREEYAEAQQLNRWILNSTSRSPTLASMERATCSDEYSPRSVAGRRARRAAMASVAVLFASMAVLLGQMIPDPMHEDSGEGPGSSSSSHSYLQEPADADLRALASDGAFDEDARSISLPLDAGSGTAPQWVAEQPTIDAAPSGGLSVRCQPVAVIILSGEQMHIWCVLHNRSGERLTRLRVRASTSGKVLKTIAPESLEPGTVQPIELAVIAPVAPGAKVVTMSVEVSSDDVVIAKQDLNVMIRPMPAPTASPPRL